MEKKKNSWLTSEDTIWYFKTVYLRVNFATVSRKHIHMLPITKSYKRSKHS